MIHLKSHIQFINSTYSSWSTPSSPNTCFLHRVFRLKYWNFYRANLSLSACLYSHIFHHSYKAASYSMFPYWKSCQERISESLWLGQLCNRLDTGKFVFSLFWFHFHYSIVRVRVLNSRQCFLRPVIWTVLGRVIWRLGRWVRSTVRLENLVRLRNLVIFWGFWSEIFGQKIDFSKLPHETSDIYERFFGRHFHSKNLKNDQIEVVGPKFLNAL